MALSHWLRALRRTRTPSPARPPLPARRPMVERLEARDNPSGGLLDPTFGSGGIVNLPNTTNLAATAVAVQPDGKVVIAGSVNNVSGRNNGPYTITVQRLNRDGSLD